MEYNELYSRAEQHVTGLFANADTSKLVYHCLDHTRKVVAHVNDISAHYNLIESDKMVLCISAWFHDTGYLYAAPDVHEEKSAELMRVFMTAEHYDENIIGSIEQNILSTKWPVHPQNLLQQILNDADTYNLGTKDFAVTNVQVYKEYVNQQGYISAAEWDERAIKFLEKHKYFTDYCKDKLQDKKKKNIKMLKKELKHEPVATASVQPAMDMNKVNDKASLNLKTKGIQTMLRLTSENHLKLSDMADGKANILISVNAIIISVILSVLLRKLQAEPYLTVPTIVFLASSVITIVVAILATRPKVSEGIFSEADIAAKKTNLVFFGNFYKMPLEVYEKSMKVMMEDPDYLYSSLIKDIYYLGVVLARKYRLIRWAYNIFMFGIIISVIAFAIAVLFNSSPDAVITNAQGSPL